MRKKYKAFNDMIKLKRKIECISQTEYIFVITWDTTRMIIMIIRWLLKKKILLLRAMTLQQTYCIYGIVVNIGHNSKIMKNLLNTKTKNSMERIRNFQILFILGMEICFSVIYCMINVIFVSNSNFIIYLL